MTIYHLKLNLKQDADMLAVKEIVAAYEGAQLDESTGTVYYDAYPNEVIDLVEELHPFTYGLKTTLKVTIEIT